MRTPFQDRCNTRLDFNHQIKRRLPFGIEFHMLSRLPGNSVHSLDDEQNRLADAFRSTRSTNMYVDQQFQKGSKTIDEILSKLVGVLIGYHSQQVPRTNAVETPSITELNLLQIVENRLRPAELVLQRCVRRSREEKFAIVELRLTVFQKRIDDGLKCIVRRD